MKKTYYFSFVLLVALFLTACGNDKPKNTTNPATPSPATNTITPPASTGTVEHYTCPNGHVGFGSATQGNCSKCNTALVHNQAFHNNTPTLGGPNATTNSPVLNTNSPLLNPPAGTTPAPAATPPTTPRPAEPAQNANGVWHYTCAKGCAGGAGGQGTCATCGGALTHNQAYHN